MKVKSLTWLVLVTLIATRVHVVGKAVEGVEKIFKIDIDEPEKSEKEERTINSDLETEKVRHRSHKHVKHARTEAIKADILNKLGLDHVPNVSNVTVSVEEKRKMLRLYKKSLEETQGKSHSLFQPDEYYAKTFHIFSDSGEAAPVTDGTEMRMNPSYFYFNIHIPEPSDPNMELQVFSAKLKLYKSHVSPQVIANEKVMTDGGIRVNVYRVITQLPAVNGSVVRRKRLLDSRILSVNTVGWEEFNIRDAAQNWVSDPGTNLGLEVSCDYLNLSSVMDIVSYRDEESGVPGDFLPSITVLTHERPILVRQKRSDERVECVQSDKRRRCCRYPLWVSFADIGWGDWVVAPEGYQAYYCDGSCPHRYKTAHAFAGIKSLINLYNPVAAPAPCCTATKLGSINLLHYNDHGDVVISVYEDMVVEECKCS